MIFTPGAIATIAQVNRSALADLCTVERATRTATTSGGNVPTWSAVSARLTDLPARVSLVGSAERPRERSTGSSPRQVAEYTVALDYTDVNPATEIRTGDRLAVRSGANAETAWAMTLYVIGFDAPQSFDPFPKVLCSTQPQP